MTPAIDVSAATRPVRWTAAAGGGLLGLALLLTGCGTAAQPAPGASAVAAGGSNTYLEGVLATPSATSADPLAADKQFVATLLLNQYDVIQESDHVLARQELESDVRDRAQQLKGEAEGRAQDLKGRLEGWGVAVPEAPQPLNDDFLKSAAPSAADASEAEVTSALQAAARMQAGLLTDADRRALVTAADVTAGRIYLEHMHRLAQGAITIAGTETDEGTDDGTKALAADVASTSQDVKGELRTMLVDRGAIGADPSSTVPPSGYTGPISLPSAVGGDGGAVDYTPKALQSMWQSLPPSSGYFSEAAGGSASSPAATPSPTPSPADTARPTPSPAPAATPSR